MEQNSPRETVAVCSQPVPLGLLQPDRLQASIQHPPQEGFGGSGSGYTLWGASGLADMGEASGDVALTLAPGDGVFLRLEAPAN